MITLSFVAHYFYFDIGVEQFYLVDNNSTDDPLRILQPYIDDGLITYERRDKSFRQLENYWHMFTAHKMETKVKWLLVVDIDEVSKTRRIVCSKKQFKSLVDHAHVSVDGGRLFSTRARDVLS